MQNLIYLEPPLYLIPNEDIQLISTSQFKYGKYPFEAFNYLQSLCYPYHDKDCNMVISAATSAGKTIVAELAVAYVISQGKKAIFLSPLKAVTAEKFDDWTSKDHYFSKLKVEIITGDHVLNDAKKKRLQEAELILMTSEMLDTRTRYKDSEGSKWLKEVGILVVDEAHLLTNNRGPALEVGLMRFTEQNPTSRLVLLSATMSNCDRVGSWIEKLNQKETFVIDTPWRPVDLHHHEIQSNWEIGDVIKILEALVCDSNEVAGYLVDEDPQVRLVAENRMKGGIDNKKTLVFVHTKSAGRDLERRLADEGYKVEFHNADLDKSKRNKLEKKFRSDELDILIATSTLAWGVNLPARSTVVIGDKRGTSRVDPLDIKQMIGRAGRFGMYSRGDAYLINCQLETEFKITSQLGKCLPFHIVAEIYNGTFNTLQGLSKWYSRSLAFQLREYSSWKVDLRATLDSLVEWNCITQKEDEIYTVTPLGRIARDLYLDPEDIYNWNKNFTIIESRDLWEQLPAIAWAICDGMKTVSLPYVPQALRSLLREFRQQFGSSMKLTNETYIVVVHHRLIRELYDSYTANKIDSFIAPYLQAFLRDSGRIFGALTRISKLNRWDRERDFEVLKARIVHGVGEHLMELVQIPGIGGTIATQLYKAGFKTLQDVIDNRDELSNYIARKGNVTRILNGLKELD